MLKETLRQRAKEVIGALLVGGLMPYAFYYHVLSFPMRRMFPFWMPYALSALGIAATVLFIIWRKATKRDL